MEQKYYAKRTLLGVYFLMMLLFLGGSVYYSLIWDAGDKTSVFIFFGVINVINFYRLYSSGSFEDNFREKNTILWESLITLPITASVVFGYESLESYLKWLIGAIFISKGYLYLFNRKYDAVDVGEANFHISIVALIFGSIVISRESVHISQLTYLISTVLFIVSLYFGRKVYLIKKELPEKVKVKKDKTEKTKKKKKKSKKAHEETHDEKVKVNEEKEESETVKQQQVITEDDINKKYE